MYFQCRIQFCALNKLMAWIWWNWFISLLSFIWFVSLIWFNCCISLISFISFILFTQFIYSFHLLTVAVTVTVTVALPPKTYL